MNNEKHTIEKIYRGIEWVLATASTLILLSFLIFKNLPFEIEKHLSKEVTFRIFITPYLLFGLAIITGLFCGIYRIIKGEKLNFLYLKFARRISFMIAYILLGALTLKLVNYQTDNVRKEAAIMFHSQVCLANDPEAEKYFINLGRDGNLKSHPINYGGLVSYIKKTDELSYKCKIIRKKIRQYNL